ncbi:MAG: nuclear transport factor 2 family protein [Hydrogenovibrio sp.]
MNSLIETQNYKRALRAYIEAYETLTPLSLHTQLLPLFARGAYFEDPFNRVYGVAAIGRVFEHMFDSVEKPQFKVTHSALNQSQVVSGHLPVAFLEWQFTFSRAGGQVHCIVGTSKVVFDANGLVLSHIDFWDTGRYVYQQVPVLRSVIRWVNRRLKAPLDKKVDKETGKEQNKSPHQGQER